MSVLRAAMSAAMVLCAAAWAAAQSYGGPPMRADDGDIWHVTDNVALLAFQPNALELGAAYSPIDASGGAVSVSNLRDGKGEVAAKAFPFAYFRTSQGSLISNWMGGALRFGKLASFGYAYAWGNAVPGNSESSLGLILRPVDFASLGMTLDSSSVTPSALGIGLAVRPLVFSPALAPRLTLTADAQLQGGSFRMQSAGAHVILNQTFGFRGWYDFQNSGIGLEATLAFGPANEHVAVASVAKPVTWTLGESVGFTPGREPPQPVFGRSILVIKDYDAIVHNQRVSSPLVSFFSRARTISFRRLVDEVRRAADDPRIAAVVLENLPSLGGPASVQEFAAALAKVRKAGKRVYVYARNYPRSFQFQLLASEANWIGVSPGGAVILTGRSVRRLYLKDFLDRLGIHFVNLAPWKTKSAFNNFSESKMSAAERDMLVRYEGDLQSQALDAFVRGRGARLKGTPTAILDAGPYLRAERALKEGVIDGMQYKGDFEEMVKKETPGAYFITSYQRPRDISWGQPLVTRRVAVVYLNGTIVPGKGIAGGSIGTDAADLLRRLVKDKSIAAILLRINSPGGVEYVADEIAHEVKKAVEGGKPVVVSMGDYAASGGYYISANATRIFAEPATITGSIGVTGLIPNLSGTLAKLGINADGVELSKSADTLDPTVPLRARDLRLTHDAVLADYSRFVSGVAKGRHIPTSRVEELGKGQVWTGREALSNGLVDALGGLGAAEGYLQKKLGGNVQFTSYRPGESSPFGGVFGGRLVAAARAAVIASLSGTESASLLGALDKAAAPYARELADILELGGGPLYYDWRLAMQ